MSSISNSSIGLGGISTSGGSPSLGNTLFGVDINALIDTLVEAKNLPNIQRQVRIDANTAKLSAYSELEGKLTALRSAASTLRNPSVISGFTDAFDAKQTLSRASGSIDAADLFGISATDSAQTGTYSLTITRIATSDTISGTVAIPDTDSTAVLAVDGNLVLEGTNIALTSTMDLEQIKDAINNVSDITKVRASIVQAGASDYRLVLKSTETGNAISISDNQTGSILASLGLAASGATDTTLSAAMVLDGISVIRSTNSVNDLIDGLSIELFQADPGKPVTITVDNNLSGIGDSIAAFMTAYNDVVGFVQDQRAVGAEGALSEDQVLFNDTLMQSTYRSLQSILSTGASGVESGALQLLRDIGIDLTSDGLLATTDTSKFEDALLSNLDGVRALFGYADSATTGFEVVDRPASIPATLLGKDITIRVLTTNGAGEPTSAEFVVDGVTTAATIENGFIKGADGSDYEGFVIGYTGGVVGATPYTGTFHPTQGIADLVAAMLDPVLDSQTGDLKAAKDEVRDSTTSLENQITVLDGQLDLYRTRLTLQFQAAQDAIAALESQKNSIQAYVDSLNSSN